MIEAVNTTASPAAIWAIVVVAVVLLAFWLGAVAWADLHPDIRHRSVQDNRDIQDMGPPRVPVQRTGEADRPEHSVASSRPADQASDAEQVPGPPTRPATRSQRLPRNRTGKRGAGEWQRPLFGARFRRRRKGRDTPQAPRATVGVS